MTTFKSLVIHGGRTSNNYSLDYTSVINKLISEAEKYSNGLSSNILEIFETNVIPTLKDCDIKSSRWTFGFKESGVDAYICADTKYSTIWHLSFCDQGNGYIRMELNQIA